jgi:hypothetical protein
MGGPRHTDRPTAPCRRGPRVTPIDHPRRPWAWFHTPFDPSVARCQLPAQRSAQRLRHHRGGHPWSAIAPRSHAASAQRPSVSRRRAPMVGARPAIARCFCSTPFSITAAGTHGRRSPCDRTLLLRNAFQHHSGGHSWSAIALRSHASSAQRLSASQRRALVVGDRSARQARRRPRSHASSAQRLRHHRGGLRRWRVGLDPTWSPPDYVAPLLAASGSPRSGATS